MENISVKGLLVTVNAIPTFPALVLSQWADDTDPLDLPELEIASNAMGVNGDLVVWTSPKPIEVKLSVIPDSSDDRNLAILFNNNRAAKGKRNSNDLVTLSFVYPDNPRPRVLRNGHVKAYTPGTSSASSGRKKSKTYSFVFENIQ